MRLDIWRVAIKISCLRCLQEARRVSILFKTSSLRSLGLFPVDILLSYWFGGWGPRLCIFWHPGGIALVGLIHNLLVLVVWQLCRVRGTFDVALCCCAVAYRLLAAAAMEGV